MATTAAPNACPRRRCYLRLAGSLLALLAAFVEPVAAQTALRGTVRAADDGRPVAAAHVFVSGTTRGSITNSVGQYELVVPQLPATLEFRHIGFLHGSRTVAPGDARTIDVDLEPVVLELGEVFVTTDDFAENVIRKVIERKQAARSRMRTGSARGYSRTVLENETDIVLVAEVVFDHFIDRARGARNVVLSIRETGDLYNGFGINPADLPLNLYDDFIPIQGVDFVGPTHPQALERYVFTFARTRALDSLRVYDMYVAPRDTDHPTFIGTLSVIDSLYTMAEATLRPARHVVFPEPVVSWPVFYRQQYLNAEGHPQPVDLRAEGAVAVAYGGETLRAQLTRTTVLTDHRINPILSPRWYASDASIQIDSAAVFEDYLFMRGQNMAALEPREAVALIRLRRTPTTLERAFITSRRRALWASFRSDRHLADGPQFKWPSVYGYIPSFRFNRVDGYTFFIGQQWPFSPRTEVDWTLGQSAGVGKIRGGAAVTRRFGRGGSATARYLADTAPAPASGLVPFFASAIPSLLGQPDYFDVFWNRRGSVRVQNAWPRFRAEAGLVLEKHRSLERANVRSWPFALRFPPNPPVDEGRLLAVDGRLAVGSPRQPLRTGALNRAELKFEAAPGRAFGSDFRYAVASLSLDGSLPTFGRGGLRPARFDVRASGTMASPGTPVQRWGAVEGTVGPYSSFGSLRSLRHTRYTGTRTVGLYWAHDFGRWPFAALGIRFLADRGSGLRLYGGHARATRSTARTSAGTERATMGYVGESAGWHHEVGLAFTAPLGLPLRLDLTRRLDEAQWFVGFGFARKR